MYIFPLLKGVVLLKWWLGASPCVGWLVTVLLVYCMYVAAVVRYTLFKLPVLRFAVYIACPAVLLGGFPAQM